VAPKRRVDRRQGLTASARSIVLIGSMTVLNLTGCATTQPVAVGRIGPREPGIVLASSHLTRDGGLRLVAKVETGGSRIVKASLNYAVSDTGRAAPLAKTAEGSQVDLVRATAEDGDIDRKNGEVSFSLGRRALADLGDRCLWYRWSVLLEGSGPSGGRALTGGFYRTSRAEAGLPRAAQVAGPDTSLVVTAPLAKTRR